MVKRTMRQYLACVLAVSAISTADAQTPAPPPYPSPGEIVAAAPPTEWVDIAPADLVVMDLAADARGKPRRVVIQLMPAPFSQGWVGNIRRLVAARWYDGVSINRVQDNYVVQWGDADGEDAAKAKALPDGLAVMGEGEYVLEANVREYAVAGHVEYEREPEITGLRWPDGSLVFDPYTRRAHVGFFGVFPMGSDDYGGASIWPVHCYGMVGVGRGMSPDTGSGAELYTVIGHAPRHLDRNIALVGRVIEGIEHLSSLPRGTGPLGFYENAEERVPITSVRMGNEVEGLAAYHYLGTSGAAFAIYAEARANRRDPFFITPAGGADICNIPVPVRRKPAQ